MGAAVVPALSSAPVSDEACNSSDETSEIVARFVEAERDASRAYQVAYLLDAPAEQLKQQLIELVQEFGVSNADGSKKLRVGEFELTVTAARSRRVDHIAIRRFRYALIKDGRGANGIASEIFEADMVYSFRRCAPAILEGMKLSGKLRDLLEKCEIVSTMPILDVSRIATE